MEGELAVFVFSGWRVGPKLVSLEDGVVLVSKVRKMQFAFDK